eukprot:jgi/Ulvmu1/9213/UM005_0313.1
MPFDVRLKEDFVSGHSGTTWLEIVLITCVFPFARLLFAVGQKAFSACGDFSQHLLSGHILLLLTLLSCWRSEIAWIMVVTVTGFALAAGTWQRTCRTARRGHDGVNTTSIQAAVSLHAHPKTYVTLFRAGLTVYTCIAILAVDFRYFPRRLAKAETFGTGLMDLGPGLYVFSFGLMLGLRIQRLQQTITATSEHRPAQFSRAGQPAKQIYGRNDPASLLLRATLSVGPLVALGAARLVLTKAVEYQEHQSEYGVQWNFFFTLATVACLVALLPLSGAKAALMSGLLTVFYQGLLLRRGWTDWLAGDERDLSSVFDSNKEGIMSLFGYSAICYAGAATAAALDANNQLVITSSHLFMRLSPSTGTVYSISAVAWHVMLWCLAGSFWMIAFICDVLIQPVSRRFANAGYVAWTVALAVTQLALSAIVEVVASRVDGEYVRASCAMVQSLSKHQLAAFLVANVATGIVNLSVDTLSASETFAFVIMLVYCASWGYVGCWIETLATPLSWFTWPSRRKAA